MPSPSGVGESRHIQIITGMEANGSINDFTKPDYWKYYIILLAEGPEYNVAIDKSRWYIISKSSLGNFQRLFQMNVLTFLNIRLIFPDIFVL